MFTEQVDLLTNLQTELSCHCQNHPKYSSLTIDSAKWEYRSGRLFTGGFDAGQ